MDFASFFDYDKSDPNLADSEGEVFLPNLSQENWTRILSVAQQRSFRAGDVVVRSGDMCRVFYIVAKGRLELFVPEVGENERHLYDIEPFSIFGEQAFFDGLPRSASVRAHTDGELFRITADSFETLAVRYPDLARMVLLDLGRILALRLRELTNLMLNNRF